MSEKWFLMSNKCLLIENRPRIESNQIESNKNIDKFKSPRVLALHIVHGGPPLIGIGFEMASCPPSRRISAASIDREPGNSPGLCLDCPPPPPDGWDGDGSLLVDDDLFFLSLLSSECFPFRLELRGTDVSLFILNGIILFVMAWALTSLLVTLEHRISR